MAGKAQADILIAARKARNLTDAIFANDMDYHAALGDVSISVKELSYKFRDKSITHRDKKACEHLLQVIEEEFERGDDGIPPSCYYLFEFELDDVLKMDITCQNGWICQVEAAREYVRVHYEGQERNTYAPERAILRQWLESRRYYEVLEVEEELSSRSP